MIEEQQSRHEQLPGDHEANTDRGPDWKKHNEGREQLSLNYLCNRSKKDERV
jgi:hypothetical protein